jgi:hypothetical protein
MLIDMRYMAYPSSRLQLTAGINRTLPLKAKKDLTTRHPYIDSIFQSKPYILECNWLMAFANPSRL